MRLHWDRRQPRGRTPFMSQFNTVLQIRRKTRIYIFKLLSMIDTVIILNMCPQLSSFWSIKKTSSSLAGNSLNQWLGQLMWGLIGETRKSSTINKAQPTQVSWNYNNFKKRVCKKVWFSKKICSQPGVESATSWMQVGCSTHWAICAMVFDGILFEFFPLLCLQPAAERRLITT